MDAIPTKLSVRTRHSVFYSKEDGPLSTGYKFANVFYNSIGFNLEKMNLETHFENSTGSSCSISYNFENWLERFSIEGRK